MSNSKRDIAWRPAVPTGHTVYTWGRIKQHQEGGSTSQSQSSSSTSTSQSSSQSSNQVTPASSTPSNRLPVAGVDPLAPSSSANPILPKSDKRNILITSALPYVNNVPHLGNIIGSVLSADVFARYSRLRGWNAVYVCGTDEYGTATETKAIEAKMTPQQICDHYHKIHADIYQWFDISFDHFGRTTTPQQTEIAQQIFHKCDENGYLINQSMQQLYCEKDSRFLADRFVEGECPLCHYGDARGDQCDGCGKLLNATELINPKCKLCKTPPIQRSSEHLFLDLKRIASETLGQWVKDQEVKGAWTANAIATTKAWLDLGLEPRCITRDLKWGTPVPKAGYEDKVFYVWFDAPIGYISITACYSSEWKQWWMNPTNVELFQFMGKDNTPFHTVVFPASLQATKENWTMLHHINTTEYLQYEGLKFSKSRGTGVFGDDVKSVGIPCEVWRYYMLNNRPEQADTVFMWEDLQAKNNTELLNNFGNFCQRTLMFIKNNFGCVIPAYDESALAAEDREFIASATAIKRRYVELMDAVRIKEGLKEAMKLSSEANVFMQTRKPWDLFKTDLARCCAVVNISVNIVLTLATLVQPFMPQVTRLLSQQLNYSIQPADLTEGEHDFQLTIKPGHQIGSPVPIFRKIEDSEILGFRAKFGGVATKNKGASFPLKLVFGKVVECQEHPTAEHLFVLKIDTGDAAPRTIVAGLKPHYTKETLEGKMLVVLVNLKYSNFKGVKSEGLVLTAVKKSPSIITVDDAHLASVKPGDVCVPVDCKLDAPAHVDWKTESKRMPLETMEGGVIGFGGLALQTPDGAPVIAQNLVQGAKIQ